VEEPGYGKIRQIYAAGGVECVSATMDRSGIKPESLQKADVLHFSPAHHFPTGLVTPVSRRMELLNWAYQGEKWIIEDDYDSEFRSDAHPMPAMQSLDRLGRVIYMNTFSKSLAPSIRISYMVLPSALMEEFQQKLGFYSCTVPSFEQYTLARFLSRGHFEKHINRMRKFYRSRRARVVQMYRSCAAAHRLTILEQDAGLHFLLQVDTDQTDAWMTARLAEEGIRVRALSEYFHESTEDRHCLVVNYSGLKEETLQAALDMLGNIM
jgi:GntR family transcriptional regulator/MocR family aminotransferase